MMRSECEHLFVSPYGSVMVCFNCPDCNPPSPQQLLLPMQPLKESEVKDE